MTEKPKIDWEAIEREFRAGQLSVREIAKVYGVSHTAIQKRAKAQGWTQNLSDRIRDAVAAKLVATGNQRETIEVFSDRVVGIVREHQTSIGRGQRLVTKLFGDLEDETEIALPVKATTLSNLANALKTLIGLERQAFSLDVPTSDTDKNDTAFEVVFVRPKDAAPIT